MFRFYDIFYFLVSFLLIAETFAATTSEPCRGLLDSREHSLRGTKGLIAYLEVLLQRGVLSDEELLRLLEGIDRGELLNPVQGWDGVSLIHKGGIQRHLDSGRVLPGVLRSWLERTLRERDRIRGEKREVFDETEKIYWEPQFHSIPEGQFQRGNTTVHLTNAIEVMIIPVTQKHWVDLMGKNPAKFGRGKGAVVQDINGKSVHLSPDHPMENITWWSALEFANRLSEKAGLRPTYDFEKINWKPDTYAENGTLEPEVGSLGIRFAEGTVRTNELHFSPEQYYLASGYRLPTAAEQRYILAGAGATNSAYAFGDRDKDLKFYAWYSKNSGRKTHRVGQLQPITINGGQFFDLHGNVSEMTWDSREQKISGPHEVGDIFNPVTGVDWRKSVLLFGGNWKMEAAWARTNNCMTAQIGVRYSEVGFRLVRTLNLGPPKDE